MKQPMKKTHKPIHRRTLWGIGFALVLLLLCLSFSLWYCITKSAQNLENIEVPANPSTKKILYTSETNSVERITITQKEGETYTLVNQGEQLYLVDGDEKRIINQTYGTQILDEVTLISVEDTVAKNQSEVEEQLGDMGLVEPMITVKTSYTDGQTKMITIGNPVPLSTYYYYQWSGNEGIYMCNLGIYELFSMPKNQLLPMDQPVIASTLIDQITLDYTQRDDLEMTFTRDDLGLMSGMIQAPIVYPMDAQATESLLIQMEQFTLGSFEGVATEENKEKYGLNDPFVTLTVHQKAGAYNAVDEKGQMSAKTEEENEVTLIIGARIDENYYACQYLDSIYLISGLWFNVLLDKEPEDYVTKTPLNLGNAAISSMVFQIGEGALDVRVTYTEEVLENNDLALDEDGNIAYHVTATCNGEEMSEDEMYSLLIRLQSFTVRGNMEVLDANFSIANRVPRWQMTLVTVGGTTRTVTAYSIDHFTDALVVDGVLMHYADVQSIDMALAERMPNNALKE